MRIILANKYYYPRGGDCIYTIELEKLLKSKGHKVAIFTQQYEENLPSDFSKYWPSKVDYSINNIRNISESFLRPIYSKEVQFKFKKLIDDFKPNIVHLNNIHSQISPIIAKVAFERNIPVIWTLHDYKLLCPSYSCLRNGRVCELCFKNKINVVKYRCVKNIVGSIIAYWEAKKWNQQRLEKYTNVFIAPSRFMKEKMIQGGFDGNKIEVINNFIDVSKLTKFNSEKEDYYLYVGRFSKEKGVETLLKAAINLPYKLKLAGSGPLFSELHNRYENKNIEFLGFKNWSDLKNIISRARFIVTPSEWYENNPISVIESLCLGTPVLGARIGGIPEMINEGINGMTFTPGDIDDLKNKINEMFQISYNNNMIRLTARQKYSSDIYYSALIRLYQKYTK